jgi:hypothetical protein
VREKLVANFEHKSASLPTAYKRHRLILLALCLVFTKKNYLSGAYAIRCSATFAYTQHVIDKRIFEPQKNELP